MAVYTTSKCGHCGVEWEFMEYGRHSSFGSPVVKCQSCNHLNKTNFKLYREMNFFDKIWFLSGQLLVKFIYGLFGMSFGVVMFYFLFIKSDSAMYPESSGMGGLEYMISINNWIGIIIFMFIPIGGGYAGYTNFKDCLLTFSTIKSLEKTFDKNGGFLWSNEQF